MEIMFGVFAQASMRPGQAAPEFHGGTGDLDGQARSFNEAGAGCPGIQAAVRL